MDILLAIIAILFVMWIIGKGLWLSQDKREINLNPNHPSRLSKKVFPIGSGTCPARNGDRHIWDYGFYEEHDGPYNRVCKHCEKHESRYMSSANWHNV